MKIIINIILLLLISQFAWAQSKKAVYLNNGSIINGRVEDDGDKVKVYTADGSLWVFDKSEVRSLGQALKPNYQKEKGFVSMTHFSLMIGNSRNNWGNEVYTTPSIRTFIGYQKSPHLAFGLSTGIDGYSTMPLIPLMMGLRGDFFKSSTTLYYGLDFGHSVAWTKEEGSGWGSGREYEGGLVINPMIGLKRYGQRGGGFYMQLAWSMQEASYKEFWWGDSGSTTRKETYKRMQIGIGLFF